MVFEDDMTERSPPRLPDRIAPEALAFDTWLRRSVADRFGSAMEPAPDDLVLLAGRLFV
jgi:hypothetical protein